MTTPSLFEPTTAGHIALKNRIVMAPLTRNRAPRAVPTPLMATYYSQRASAGLLITEATAISHQGQGYADVPGLYAPEQIEGWKRVTDAVHAAGGKIVTQLWHVGRVSHTELQPGGGQPVAPSAVRAKTKTVLIVDGVPTFVETSEPRALDITELPGIVDDYRRAALAAIEAGFDGVEIHAANGYLLDQFLKTESNRRTDAYGGSIENRARLLIENIEIVKGPSAATLYGTEAAAAYFSRRREVTMSNGQALYRVAHEDLALPDDLGPSVDDGLRAILQRGMARRPSERYASAAEFRDALRAWAAPATWRAPRAWRWLAGCCSARVSRPPSCCTARA